jgi:hypothetical protein
VRFLDISSKTASFVIIQGNPGTIADKHSVVRAAAVSATVLV